MLHTAFFSILTPTCPRGCSDVLLVLAVLAIPMAVGTIWLFLKKQGLVFIAVSWLFFLAVAYVGSTRITHEEATQIQTWNGYLLGMTATFAKSTEELDHYRITEDGYDPAIYGRLIDLHRAWCRDSDIVGYVFTLRLVGPRRVEYICSCPVDINRDGKIAGKLEEGDPPFTPYVEEDDQGRSHDAWYDVYAEGFAGKSAIDPNVVSDEYGKWVTAVAPLHDPEGNIEAILGVDFRTDHWVNYTRQLRNKSLQLLIAINVLFFTGMFSLASLRVSLRRANEMNEHLSNARKAAETASRAKSDFLANMSHEIRTPMNAILGFTNILKAKIASGCSEQFRNESEELLEVIQKNGDELLTIINDILEFTKTESRQLQPELIPVAFHELIKDIAWMGRIHAEKKGLLFSFAIDSGVPERILSDPARLKHLLANILGNAVKFTEKGSVRLHVQSRESTDEKSANVSEGPRSSVALRIDVIDTGIGMSEETLARAIAPFVQGDSSSTRKYGGTGLGLSVAKGLAKLLGGDIFITSRQDEGTTCSFSFRVPVLEPGEIMGAALAKQMESSGCIPDARTSPSETPSVDPVAATAPSLSGRSVLVVEDLVINQIVITSILHDAGAEVEIAENGQVAIDKINARGRFDVVLMDMQMPVLDGYEATHILREAGYSGLIIAVTAHALSGDREKTLEVGCDEYLSKPVHRELLLDTIQQMLVRGGRT